MKTGPLTILGIMSGTSLDGLDLALCRFSSANGKTAHELLAAETVPYEPVWKERLRNAYEATAEQYFKLHSLYGEFIATQAKRFLEQQGHTANYIASHGHTVFHRPQLGFSTQMGCGATIAAHTGIATISDFRSLDVALNGQGAPLVPIGDRDLFPGTEACLNIGGIANISFTKQGLTRAYDICIANIALNLLAERMGKAYDAEGALAASGRADEALVESLCSLHSDRRSLGKEWFEQRFLPLLESSRHSVPDLLASCTLYTARMVARCLSEEQIGSLLVSGGGAYNRFLLSSLKQAFPGRIDLPSDRIIQFKEALIFAYLGYLRAAGHINTLSSVTGASQDSSGGCIYQAIP